MASKGEVIPDHRRQLPLLSGFTHQFWVNPARPWFLLIPASGDVIAVIPELGRASMETTGHVNEIRTWPSPRPQDEGISLSSGGNHEGVAFACCRS